MPGLAIGLLVFGSCTAVGALRLGRAAWQFEQGAVAVVGHFVSYEQLIDIDARGRRTRTLAPRIAYEAADGEYGAGTAEALALAAQVLGISVEQLTQWRSVEGERISHMYASPRACTRSG